MARVVLQARRASSRTRQKPRTKTSRQEDFDDASCENGPNFSGHAFAITGRRCEGTARSGVPTHFPFPRHRAGCSSLALLHAKRRQEFASEFAAAFLVRQPSGIRFLGGPGIRLHPTSLYPYRIIGLMTPMTLPSVSCTRAYRPTLGMSRISPTSRPPAFLTFSTV